MDSQNPSGKKLAGLRTFARDQERVTNKTDNSGVGFVVSAQDSIAGELSKISKEPTITETSVTKQPPVEQKLAAPKEHKIVEQRQKEPIITEASVTQKPIEQKLAAPKEHKTVHEIDLASEKNSAKNDKILSLEQELDSKKPEPTPIPQLTRKTDAEIYIKDSGENAGGATIITDTKKDRFKLFPAISESLKGWFKELQKNREEKKKPKYTVPETTRRKGVIQKATSQTGKIATADHDSLQERIRQRLQKEIVGFGNETKEDHITWTPNTEPGFPLLEAGDSAGISNIQIVPRKNFYTKQQEIVFNNSRQPNREIVETEKKPVNETSVAVETKTESTRDLTETNSGFTNTVYETPKEEVLETIPSKSNLNLVEEHQNEVLNPVPKPSPKLDTHEEFRSEIEVNEKIEKEDERDKVDFVESTENYPEETEGRNEGERDYIENNYEETEPETVSRKRSFSINTNLLSLILVIIIVAILIVTGLGENLIKSSDKQPDIESVNINYQPLLSSEIRFISIPNNKSEIENTVINENNTENKINQFVFVSGESKELVKPSTLLIGLNFGSSASFNQAVTNMYFGSIDKSPFIAMQITDTTTAKGGMLQWEKTLSSDLKTIFNLSGDNRQFVDGLLGGVDVRVLKNSNNQDEIIYGFTSNNTIIISKDSRTFTELLELTKQ